mmetsp:Transcript_6171/g.11685  ORF Transcript_6171/g.11685 Transcript_6171/m.11685 type:complete len:332 (-) Transcript_6171:520-1515(-)
MYSVMMDTSSTTANHTSSLFQSDKSECTSYTTTTPDNDKSPQKDSNSTTCLLIRPLQIQDRDPLQQLHEEIFPVKYTEDFYDNTVKNKSLSGHALYSRVIVKIDNDMRIGSNQVYSTAAGGADGGGGDHDDDMESCVSLLGESSMENLAKDVDLHGKIFQNIKISERIEVSCHNDEANGEQLVGEVDDALIGCIIGGFYHAQKIQDEKLRDKLIRNFNRHSRVFYIMTLGTTQSFRKHKLGTKLVKDCLEMVQQVPSCGVVYLHVITYNRAAIQFYERLGFYRIEEIQDYYLIDGSKYNCYLYAYFINGNRPSLYLTIKSAYHKLLKFIFN